MNPELSLWDQPIPPHSDDDTSREAAVAKWPTAAAQRERVYDCVARTGGATQEEISANLALSGDSVRPRLWELTGHNGHPQRLYKSTETRLTKSGRRARVYKPLRRVA